ncbi:MAG: hypothetical protein WBA13_14290 [Microcoleaceae cyanobacterium]
MDNLPLSDLFEIGSNGAIIFVVWNLFQSNKLLVQEISSRDDQLVKIINALIDIMMQFERGK